MDYDIGPFSRSICQIFLISWGSFFGTPGIQMTIIALQMYTINVHMYISILQMNTIQVYVYIVAVQMYTITEHMYTIAFEIVISSVNVQ